MTKQNLKKFSLYLIHDNEDGEIHWEVDPVPRTQQREENRVMLEYDVDISKVNIFKITVTDRQGYKSNVRVDKMFLNGISLDNLNSMSFFKTETGIVKNFGYLDQVGDFILKLHTNPVSQNYLNYLLSLTKITQTV